MIISRKNFHDEFRQPVRNKKKSRRSSRPKNFLPAKSGFPGMTALMLPVFLEICSVITGDAISYAGDLNREIRETFAGMHTVTSPDAYKIQRRGVIAGGSVNIRNRVQDTDFLSFTAPKVKSGCRGIDLYAGSFSYINREEFIRFMRAIAANAEGYAFEIALSSMCEKCAQHMETLQRKIQALNQYFGNSCQLAQGIVNDTMGAFNRKGLNDASLKGQFEGIGDLFELNSTSPQDLYRQVSSSGDADEKDLTLTAGNLMWRSLMQNTFLSQNPEIAEAVMSITGTVIIADNGTDVHIIPGGMLSLRDLISGGGIYVYSCDSYRTGCKNVSRTYREITGFATLIKEKLTGRDGSSGIVGKYAANSGSFTSAEKEFLNTLPEGVGTMIRTLSARNGDAAGMFVSRSARILALLYAGELLKKYLHMARTAIKASDHGYVAMLADSIDRTERAVNSDMVYLSSVFGGFEELSEAYLDYLRLLPEKTYVPEDMLIQE